jgi:hypothetical protein
MQQSIRYKGLSLTPDEMAVENGALSLCGNLELHDGALRPAIVSGTPLSQPLTVNGEVAKILYVHETGSYHHLIAIASSSIYWFMQDGSLGSSTPIKSFDYESTVLSIDSIGNTLIIVATDGIHYAMWESNGQSSSDYSYKGQKPPFLNIRFATESKDNPEDYPSGGINAEGSKNGFTEAWQQSTISCGDAYVKVNGTTWKPGDICASIKEEKTSDLTQSIYALINRTNNIIARNGRFYANFFIRYCYRMFDGSMIMHSAPVFIPVQVPGSYLVQAANFYFPSDSFSEGAIDSNYGYWNEGNGTIESEINFDNEKTYGRKDSTGKTLNVSFNGATFYYYPRNAALMYDLVDPSGKMLEQLKGWKDVIKSIDFFITPPITNVDTADKISSLQILPRNYALNMGARACTYSQDNPARKYGYVVVKFPTLAEDVYKKKLQNSSAFYKVCSLDLDNFYTASGNLLPVDKNAVYQVSLQEQMKDDYKTHNYLFAEGGYVYNHRLNLYGVKEKLFSGFSDAVLLPWANYIKNAPNHEVFLVDKIVVRLKTTSGTKYVEQKGLVNASGLYYYIEQYLFCNASKFYPDSRADMMYLFTTDSKNETKVFGFPLTPCEELNGSIHMGTYQDDGSSYLVSAPDYSVDDVVDMSNKIYTSESDNAFYFPLNGINTVGIGTIQGIASTTRALSQGQFGQYPLMAFSTDGIWAMEVSSQGTYSSIHPISREVCSNPKSITQLDQSVLFATNRSLSRIAESQVASMSDVLDGPGFNIVGNLGKFLNFFNDAEDDDDTTKTIKAQMRQLIDFTSSPIDFFQRCQVIYDYKNSRIFCLDVSQLTKEASADTVALCYSIKDEAWSTFLIKNVLTALNSYPHPYIQYRDGSVIVLDSGYDYEDETEYHGIIVTRTLKFDEENAPDAITGYIHSLTSGTVPVMWLYGSNDNQNWHYLGRLGGMKSSYMSSHSYRFFRLALYLKMKSMNQYFATRLEVIRRFNKF